MDLAICSSLRDSLSKHFNQEVRVSYTANYCTVTLPLTTLDDRRVSVIIEERLKDYFVVHDGGKTDSALFAQGIALTERKIKNQINIVEQYGAHLVDGLIQAACGPEGLSGAILAVAQSVMLSTHEVLHHRPDFLDVPITNQVGQALEAWRPSYIATIDKNVRVSRELSYRLDYVAHARDGTRSCAVKIVPPTHPMWQAERYGFIGHEMNETMMLKDWFRVAILTRAETWPNKAVGLIHRFSSNVVEIRSGHEREIPFLIPEAMNKVYDNSRLRLT